MNTFLVLPPSPNAPLTVAPNQLSDPLQFDELAGGSPRTMWLRITKLGAKPCSPSGGPPPRFFLSAGTGDPTAIPQIPATASIANGNGDIAAHQVTWKAENLDVYCIMVTGFVGPGSKWNLQIQNRDNDVRAFTCVVAENDEDAQQPWIDIFEPVVPLLPPPHGTTVATQSRGVANLGTGPLTIQGVATIDPFSVVVPLASILPNSCGQLQIQYDTTKAGDKNQEFVIRSNDTAAAGNPGHNDVITVYVISGGGGGTGKNPNWLPCTYPRCGCPNYLPPHPPDPEGLGLCRTRGCHHPPSTHIRLQP